MGTKPRTSHHRSPGGERLRKEKALDDLERHRQNDKHWDCFTGTVSLALFYWHCFNSLALFDWDCFIGTEPAISS